jgi:hypothetical protein
MDNSVHERICSRAANVLSLAVGSPAVVVLSWSVPTWTWPQRSPAYLICPDMCSWPEVIASLKTLLETGEPLPA